MINLIAMTLLAAAPGYKLDCPAGTKQVRTDSLVACQEAVLDGVRVFHGPYLSLYANGAVEAAGQSDHGFRSGTWSFYDEKGVLVGQTEFKHGNFDGRRVFFYPDGRVKSEELYYAGRLVVASVRPRGVSR